jgi:hypothetical protein
MIISRKHLMAANLGTQQNGQQQHPHAAIQQQLPHHHHHHHPSQQQSQSQSQKQQQQGTGSVEAQLLRSKASLNSHHVPTRPIPISSAADLRRPSSGSPLSTSEVDASGASSHKPHMICEYTASYCFAVPSLSLSPSFLPSFTISTQSRVAVEVTFLHTCLPEQLEKVPHSPHLFFLSHVRTHLLPPFCAEYPFPKGNDSPSTQPDHRHLPSSNHSTRHEARFHMPIGF